MRYKARFIPLLIVFLLSFSLACGLGIPVPGFGRQESTPVVDLDKDAGSTQNSGDEANTIEQSESTPSPAPPEATQESQDDNAPAEGSSGTAELASDQIFILPGAEPTTLDPHLSGDSTSSEYVVEIFSGLLKYNRDLELVPDIAESYDVSDDGLVYTFKLRDDAVFQDGKPIRAEDFKWSFERACDPATGSTTADTYLGDVVGCRDKLQNKAQEVKGVEVIDELTLQLTIDEPKGFFPAKMTYPTAYALDRENVESGGAEWFKEANGSGPFKLTEYSPEENTIVLDRNENFYGDPKPTLERVIYLISAPINPMSGYEEGLSSLGASAGVTYDAIPLSISDLSRATDPNNPLSKEFVSAPTLSVSYVGFNVEKPPFDDPKIRQAFNLALDKRRMVKLVFQDTVPVANGIVPPNMPGYENPDLSDYEFDPERAQALVAESSYEDVTELPDITLNVPGEGSEAGPIVETMVESYKENLGVEISVEQTPWPEFLADLSKADMPYQMYSLGWVADYPDPQDFLEVLFYSTSSQNQGGYSNPEVDALLDQARGAQDPEERLTLYQQAEQMILEDAAWIPLYFSVENWLVKPYVQDFWIPPLHVPKFQYISIAEH
ncbi:MAG: peptide ABC transporter substrate-binding protein [Anaerolineales bacterium]|nr:peptide ABC transporter substrate-binding protein [Anaerolineales bacterium]